jgi:hypothetical protein
MTTFVPIEDASDSAACERAVWQMFSVIEMHHGVNKARDIFSKLLWTPEEHQAYGESLKRTYPVTSFQDPETVLLALEYYLMPKPRVKTLARVLARMNVGLNWAYRYGKHGSTSEHSMATAIGRALNDTRHLGLETLTRKELESCYWIHYLSCRRQKTLRRAPNTPYWKAAKRKDSAEKSYERLRRERQSNSSKSEGR